MTDTENTVALVATVDDQGKVKPAVSTEDPITHTAENGYRCKDHTCLCYAEANMRRNTATLNGNRPFS
jgi:hypothetical protein